ncbi:putative sugar phosphate transporter domain-containing protein [Helianthus anomalus]
MMSTDDRVGAYEADRSDGVEKIEATKRVKIVGVYFATWLFFNVIFNIYYKKVLNVFPYPWLTATLSLAAGSAIMLISWATKVAEAPNTDLEFWKSLFPIRSISKCLVGDRHFS